MRSGPHGAGEHAALGEEDVGADTDVVLASASSSAGTDKTAVVACTAAIFCTPAMPPEMPPSCSYFRPFAASTAPAATQRPAAATPQVDTAATATAPVSSPPAMEAIMFVFWKNCVHEPFFFGPSSRGTISCAGANAR